jgi:hypothetical protein
VYDIFTNLPDLSPAELRLIHDSAFGVLFAQDDEYYRTGIRLIRTINQPDPVQVRKALENYLRHAKDERLRDDLQQFLQSLPNPEER